jgi:hypothetical protein
MKRESGRLKILPCLDSEEMSETRRRELDIPRGFASALGTSAVEAAAAGHYINGAGKKVDWNRHVEAARSAKLSVAPEAPLPARSPGLFAETRVQVTNETTLGASLRLVESGLNVSITAIRSGCV